MNDIKLMPEKDNENEGNASGFNFSSGNNKGKVFSKGITGNLSKLGQDITLKGGFLFGLSLAFFIVVVLICLGLWGYKMSLDSKKDGLIQKMTELNQTRDIEFENNLMDLKDKIEGLKNILSNQVYSSNVLTILEELVVPQVRFGSLNSDISKMTVSLEVMATNIDSLVRQMVSFKDDNRIEKASFSSVNSDNSGEVSSSIELKLKPSVSY